MQGRRTSEEVRLWTISWVVCFLLFHQKVLKTLSVFLIEIIFGVFEIHLCLFFVDHTKMKSICEKIASKRPTHKWLHLTRVDDILEVFCCAAATGNLECMAQMLHANPLLLDLVDEDHEPALFFACLGPNRESLFFLTSMGANVHLRNQKGTSVDMIMSETREEMGVTPFHKAYTFGRQWFETKGRPNYLEIASRQGQTIECIVNAQLNECKLTRSRWALLDACLSISSTCWWCSECLHFNAPQAHLKMRRHQCCQKCLASRFLVTRWRCVSCDSCSWEEKCDECFQVRDQVDPSIVSQGYWGFDLPRATWKYWWDLAKNLAKKQRVRTRFNDWCTQYEQRWDSPRALHQGQVGIVGDIAGVHDAGVLLRFVLRLLENELADEVVIHAMLEQTRRFPCVLSLRLLLQRIYAVLTHEKDSEPLLLDGLLLIQVLQRSFPLSLAKLVLEYWEPTGT